MNIFLVDKEDALHEPPASVRGFVNVPSMGETIEGNSLVDFDYFFGWTDINGEYTLERVLNQSLIQPKYPNSKPILRPWYEAALGRGEYCLVNDATNSPPHRDVPFLAYKDAIFDSYGGIVLRPTNSLTEVAYYANYVYNQTILGSTCSFEFGKRINLPSGSYLIGHDYNEIMRPSTTLYNFIILYLMLSTLYTSARFNDSDVLLTVTSKGYIQVDIMKRIEADSLTLTIEF